MGADMIGYIVKAPAKFSDAQITDAADKLLKIARDLRKSGILECPNCATGVNIPNLQEDTICVDCGAHLPDYLLKINSRVNARKKVKELIGDWPPRFCDSNVRTDPDDPTQLLIFAGDMSWGDTPDGDGYNYLDALMMSGIADVLGVR